MAIRKVLSKKIRFEVLKRDGFVCQYCGNKAPDVILEIDHIKPVSRNGGNDILNLITSCFDCNRGKSDRELLDTDVITKQRTQLEKLQERREQIEMMFEWKESLVELDDDILDKVCDFWHNITEIELFDHEKKKIKSLIKKYDLDIVLDSIRIAVDIYIKYDQKGNIYNDSYDKALSKLRGICINMKNGGTINPQLFYIRGILKNRMGYYDTGECIEILKEAEKNDFDLDEIQEGTKKVKTWAEWVNYINTFYPAKESYIILKDGVEKNAYSKEKLDKILVEHDINLNQFVDVLVESNGWDSNYPNNIVLQLIADQNGSIRVVKEYRSDKYNESRSKARIIEVNRLEDLERAKISSLNELTNKLKNIRVFICKSCRYTNALGVITTIKKRKFSNRHVYKITTNEEDGYYFGSQGEIIKFLKLPSGFFSTMFKKGVSMAKENGITKIERLDDDAKNELIDSVLSNDFIKELINEPDRL